MTPCGQCNGCNSCPQDAQQTTKPDGGMVDYHPAAKPNATARLAVNIAEYLEALQGGMYGPPTIEDLQAAGLLYQWLAIQGEIAEARMPEVCPICDGTPPDTRPPDHPWTSACIGE